jgi:N-acetylmuramoyl-L-alanine amidase
MPNRQRPHFFTTAHFAISAILFRVRNSFRFAAFLFVAGATISVTPSRSARPVFQALAQSSSQQVQQPAVGPQQAVPPPQAGPQQVAPPTPAHTGPVIVLDPAHGGMDSGARGQNGIVEKDLVLLFARITRYALEREGFRVVMTRNDDSNPSYDDRAALANSYRDVIFVSFHIASTGTMRTARAYSFQFPESVSSAANSSAASAPPRTIRTPNLLPWEEAQRPYSDTSHRLADVLQADLALRFPGSPGASSAVAVRGLRSVSAPAIAVEISNVAVSDPSQMAEMAAPLATAIVRSIVASRPPAGSTSVPGAQ